MNTVHLQKIHPAKTKIENKMKSTCMLRNSAPTLKNSCCWRDYLRGGKDYFPAGNGRTQLQLASGYLSVVPVNISNS